MRTSFAVGFILALTVGLVFPLSAEAEYSNTYTLYDPIPRVAGIKTLIDFNDFNEIVLNAKGYVNARYLDEDIKDSKNAANRVGYEQGMPVIGYSLDPDGGLDTQFTRQLTKVGSLFAETDPARDRDAYAASLNAAPATGTTTTTGGTTTGNSYETLPKDQFGGVVYTISKNDLILDNWLVELNSSANTVPNRRSSYAKEVIQFPTGDPATADDQHKFLGVRIRFPEHSHNAHARVAPAYALPAFDARGYPINYGFFDPDFDKNPFGANTGSTGGATAAATAPTHTAMVDALKALEDNVGAAGGAGPMNTKVSYNGVLHNVSDIREIVVRIAGRNYRNGVAIRLRDENEEVSEYFLGYLDFAGWRTLRWVNPTYLPADEMEPFRLPLYPSEIPYVAFDSFVIYRNGTELGGEFVTYVDWVKLDYDLAVPAAQLTIGVPGAFIDVDDDAWWYILRDRNAKQTRALMQKFSEAIDLRRQQLGRTVRQAEAVAPVENPAFDARNDYEK